LAGLSDVGQVVGVGTPDDLKLEAVEALLADAARLQEFAEQTYDPRMSLDRWRVVLTVELHLLVRWAARRYLRAARGEASPGIADASDATLVLLPRYGFALHVLRRAAPLAALGQQVTVSVPLETLRDAARPISAVTQALGLEARLALSDEAPQLLVAGAERSAHPIFLTGRLATFALLRRSHPKALLCGATGTCSVVISTNEELARLLEVHLRQGGLSMSCSNHGSTLVCSDYAPSGRAYSINREANHATTPTSLAEGVRRAHPSVILAHEAPARIASVPARLEGYTVVLCDQDGIPEAREGFGRDPICGWPGDSCV
jgi:hypothetical protein